MLRIPVNTASHSYEAIIEEGALSRAGAILNDLLAGMPALFVVTVPPVRRRWSKLLLQSLTSAGFTVSIIEMPDGERFKRLSTIESLAEKLIQVGADRNAVVLAFGGGVVGDVAGMLASVYMRGVKLVQIPTTVQSQLDAAIGGKTGVNLHSGKNLMGTFYQPELVLIDPATLATLSEREFRAGMYEALKCGVIGNEELFVGLEGVSIKDLRSSRDSLAWAIAESVRLKAKVVSADEREGDLRRVLNLGHTIGHALEAGTRYRQFLHGEAVGWGMIAAARIAADLGCCPQAVHDRIREAVLRWGGLPPVTVRTANLIKLTRSDKKTEAEVLHFVLPTKIGQVKVVKDVPESAVMAAIAEIRKASRG